LGLQGGVYLAKMFQYLEKMLQKCTLIDEVCNHSNTCTSFAIRVQEHMHLFTSC